MQGVSDWVSVEAGRPHSGLLRTSESPTGPADRSTVKKTAATFDLSFLVLLLSAGLILVPNSVRAAFFDVPGTNARLTYSVSDGEVTISDCNTNASGDLSIPSMIEGSPVTTIRQGAFYNCGRLTSVTIPNGVTSIGLSAFGYCTSMTNVSIPDTVLSIGDGAFLECGRLTGVSIPSGVTHIGRQTFRHCHQLATVTISIGVTSIGEEAFEQCRSLESLVIPDSVTSIGPDAFFRCEGMTTVSLGDGLTSVPSFAFGFCTSLTTVVFGSGLDSIGTFAFVGCGALESIVLPDSLSVLGSGAFDDCSNVHSVSLGSGLVVLGDYVFRGCSSLLAITIPDSVTTLGDDLFASCESLAMITFGDSLSSIGNGMFRNCASLVRMDVPEGIDVIGDGAFSGCAGMEVVTISSTVASIGYGVFSSCGQLASIEVSSANSNYSSLGGVLFNKARTSLIRFPEGGVGVYAVPSSVTAVLDRAFEGSGGLAGVVIPGNVVSVGSGAFRDCVGLADVTIEEGVTSIGGWAFQGCTSLTSVALPASVSQLGDESLPFLLNPNLVRVDVSESNSNFASIDGVLYNKPISELIYFPQGRSGSFAIPDGVVEIRQGAFRDCAGLESVMIPASVTSVDRSAFSGAEGLLSATFYGDAPTAFGYDAFVGTAGDFQIFYFSDAVGFTSPTWKGYSSEVLAGPEVDVDGDGLGHRLEDLLGTNPNDQNSRLRAWLTSHSGGVRLHVLPWSDACEFAVQWAQNGLGPNPGWQLLNGLSFVGEGNQRSVGLPDVGDSGFFRVSVSEK